MQLPDAVDLVRASTLQILIDVETSPTQRKTLRLGSGFIASEDGHMVTALHVVDAATAALAGASGRLIAAFAGPDVDLPGIQMRSNFSLQEVVEVDRSPEHDLALVRSTSGTLAPLNFLVGPEELSRKPRPVRLAPERPRDGIDVAVSGYPFGSPTLHTNAGVLASAWGVEDGPGPMRDRYLGDFTANGGNSGGPVYRVKDGAVIGVCVAARLVPIVGGQGGQTAGITVISPAKYVVELLDRNGVKVSASSPRPAGRSGGKRRR